VNTKTGFALAKSMQLFFAGANTEIGLRVFQQLRTKFPEIDKEYADAKVKPLEVSATMSTLLMRKPIRKIDDFKGTRIRCMGDWSKVLRALGSEGVTTSTSEMYTGMQKGLLDGILGLAEGLESMKLADVTKYTYDYDLVSAPCMMRAMNLAKWNSLPPDIQKIFEADVETWTKETAAVLAAADKQALEYGKKRGVEVAPVSKEDKAQIAKLMVAIAEKDAKELDAKGLRGTQILQETQKLIKANSK
jgi:TRAP-type transport system periplasmic protein